MNRCADPHLTWINAECGPRAAHFERKIASLQVRAQGQGQYHGLLHRGRRQRPLPPNGYSVEVWNNVTRLYSLFAALCFAAAACAQSPVLRSPDVPYEPSEPEVVQLMLELARIKPGEQVVDLGCGDGRIVIAAVRQFDARGVCVDIDPVRIGEARANAARAGVADRIRFLNQDLFDTDLHEADAVMLFLWP